MLLKFKDRIPVIVQPRKDSIQKIDKRKFMTPRSLTMGQFIFVIRKRLKLKGSEALFVFSGSRLMNSSSTMYEIYENEKDEDGFLYLVYDFENVFGSG